MDNSPSTSRPSHDNSPETSTNGSYLRDDYSEATDLTQLRPIRDAVRSIIARRSQRDEGRFRQPLDELLEQTDEIASVFNSIFNTATSLAENYRDMAIQTTDVVSNRGQHESIDELALSTLFLSRRRFESLSESSPNQLRRSSSAPLVLEVKSASLKDDTEQSSVSLQRSESSTFTICRICHSSTSTIEEDLETPCFCKGTMGYVHLSCLESWLDDSGTTGCEVCGYEFTIQRVVKYTCWQGFKIWITSPMMYGVRRLYSSLLNLVVMISLLILGIFLQDSATHLYSEKNDESQYYLITIETLLGWLLIFSFLQSVWELKEYYYIWRAWWQNTYTPKIILDSPEEKENKRQQREMDAITNDSSESILFDP